MKRVLVLIFLCGCSPSSVEDFRKEGEALSRQLMENLQNIRTREEVVKAVPRLKHDFEKLVDLMIEARRFQEEEPFEPDTSNTEVSELLREELKRVYKIEGGREMIEKAQKEALIRLDAFERALKKKRTTY
jgi:hypothetical protein